MYAVKVKPPEGKVWWFLTSKGGMNRLKIHAAQIDDPQRAQRIADEIVRENPGFDAKVVTPWKD